jgi:hypothetical protein
MPEKSKVCLKDLKNLYEKKVKLRIGDGSESGIIGIVVSTPSRDPLANDYPYSLLHKTSVSVTEPRQCELRRNHLIPEIISEINQGEIATIHCKWIYASAPVYSGDFSSEKLKKYKELLRM